MRLADLLVAAAAMALLVPGPARAEDAGAKELWGKTCATCHGDDGRGQTKAGRKHKLHDFTDAAWQAQKSDEALRVVIRDGKPETKMKGFAGKLTDAEQASLLRYVRAFAKR